MKYEGIVYRPPSEARSLLIQVTIGCAHNKCSFCSMYKEKKFRIRKIEEIKKDIDEAVKIYGNYIEKVFLCDGDALVVATEMLLEIIEYIKETMPWVSRISSYAAPRDLLNKTENELKAICDAGISLLYIGAESGDDEVLDSMQKGVSSEEIAKACIKAREAGFQCSITLISGLGGRKRLKEHAINSARLISKIKPEYLGFLTLLLDEPAPICKSVADGEFELLSPNEVMEEMELFLSEISSEGTIFRANHASNYLILKGTLDRDKEILLERVREAKKKLVFRKEEARRL